MACTLYDGLAQLNGWAPTVACVLCLTLDSETGAALMSDFCVAADQSSLGVRDEQGDPVIRSAEEYALVRDANAFDDVIEPIQTRTLLARLLRTFPLRRTQTSKLRPVDSW